MISVMLGERSRSSSGPSPKIMSYNSFFRYDAARYVRTFSRMSSSTPVTACSKPVSIKSSAFAGSGLCSTSPTFSATRTTA